MPNASAANAAPAGSASWNGLGDESVGSDASGGSGKNFLATLAECHDRLCQAYLQEMKLCFRECERLRETETSAVCDAVFHKDREASKWSRTRRELATSEDLPASPCFMRSGSPTSPHKDMNPPFSPSAFSDGKHGHHGPSRQSADNQQQWRQQRQNQREQQQPPPQPQKEERRLQDHEQEGQASNGSKQRPPEEPCPDDNTFLRKISRSGSFNFWSNPLLDVHCAGFNSTDGHQSSGPVASQSSMESEDERGGREKKMFLKRQALGTHLSSPSQPHLITVDIISASGLRDADLFIGGGTSDPYTTVEIRGKPHTRHQTQVINNNLNPVWNCQVSLDDFEMGDILDFAVYDSDRLKCDDLLGKASMEGFEFIPDGFAGMIELETPYGEQSRLHLRIIPANLEMVEDVVDEEATSKLVQAASKRWPPIENSISRCESKRSTLNMHSAARVTAGALVRNGSRCEQGIVINPLQMHHAWWDVLSSLCVAYDIFMVPFTLAFDVPYSELLYVLSFVVAFFWTLDIPRSCILGYHSKGVIEMRLSRIVVSYFKSWFLPDLALVVLDWTTVVVAFMNRSGSPHVSRLFRAVRIIRSARAISFIRLLKVHETVEHMLVGVRTESLRALLEIASIIALMLVLCHFLACGFYIIGQSDPARGWVAVHDMEVQGLAYTYFSSAHWALTQFMPASSGINAGTTTERCFAFVVDVFGFVCFSFFVSNVNMQLNALKQLNRDRYRRDAEMRRFFNEHKVSLELSSSITEYVRKDVIAKQRRLKESEIKVFRELPREMQKRLRLELYLPHLVPHPFFDALLRIDPIGFQNLCAYSVGETQLTRGEEVFAAGAEAQGIYLVSHGSFIYRRPSSFHDVGKNCWISEAALWIDKWVHRGRLNSLDVGELNHIAAQDFGKAVIRSSPGAARVRFVRMYASQFIKQGFRQPGDPLNQSDLWGDVEDLKNSATRAETWATGTETGS